MITVQFIARSIEDYLLYVTFPKVLYSFVLFVEHYLSFLPGYWQPNRLRNSAS